MRRLTSFGWLPLLAGLVGCSQPTGTFVKLNFLGAVSPGMPIASIVVDLQFEGGPGATTSFPAKGSKGIVLPTDAVLEIQAGAGLLHVSARALAGDQSVLGTGTGSGTVVRDKTVPIEVNFAGVQPDAGADGPLGIDGPPGPGVDTGVDTRPQDAATDSPADLPLYLDVPGGDVGVRTDASGDGLDTGVDAPGTGGVIGTGGAGGSGAAGGSGGTGGGGTSGTYHLTATPSPLDFGNIQVATVSPPAALTISNTGTAPTPVLTISDGDPNQFPVYRDGCSGTTLNPGGVCILSFTFNPTQSGLAQTDGSVGPAGVVPAKFTMMGSGVSGTSQIGLLPATVDFKIVDVNVASSVDFTVTNNGTTDAGTLSIQPIGSASFRITNSRCGGTLGPQSKCLFTLTFTPTAYGPVTAVINAQSSSGSAASASATGTGRDSVPLAVGFAGTGAGVVTGGPQNCPSGNACSFSVPRTDPNALPQFTLTPQPDSLSVFGGWSGDCTGTGTCTVVMSAAHTVTATFNPRMVTLNLTVLGLAGQQGSVVSDDGSITCKDSCPNLSHAAATSFTLTAKPAAGSTFVGWAGSSCKGTAPRCTFPLTDPVTISATFGPQSYMFVSSSVVVPGKLGSLDAADAECARLATNASLPGKYAAWLSSSTSNAYARVGDGGWVRTDGRPFARDFKSLSDPAAMTVYYPPRLDEKGNDLGNVRTFVATGSNADGSGAGAYCKDYTSTAGGLAMGDAASGAYAWSNNSLDAAGCGSARHLYCFRTELSGFITPLPQEGRRIFVTTNPFVIGDGLTPDELCWKDADAAGIADAKTFVAFVATTSTAALKLVKPTGLPWKRMDGVFVTQQPNDLGGGKLLAPIDVTADGKGYTNARVWAGATDPTVPGSLTCGDWKGAATTGSGLVGDSQTTAAPPWFDLMSIPCDNLEARLYCIEP